MLQSISIENSEEGTIAQNLRKIMTELLRNIIPTQSNPILYSTNLVGIHNQKFMAVCVTN